MQTVSFNRSAGFKGPSTLATLFNHMWPRIVAGIFIPVGNHYFQALASTLQFVAQVCDRLWLVPATDRAFAYITYMSPPHVALVCSGPPQCAATCGWTKWPVCSGPKQLAGKIKSQHEKRLQLTVPWCPSSWPPRYQCGHTQQTSCPPPSGTDLQQKPNNLALISLTRRG